MKYCINCQRTIYAERLCKFCAENLVPVKIYAGEHEFDLKLDTDVNIEFDDFSLVPKNIVDKYKNLMQEYNQMMITLYSYRKQERGLE